MANAERVVGLLSGFDHEAVQKNLAIGDVVCLLPDGRNGIVACRSTGSERTNFRKTSPANVWVEILPDRSQMPENIANCRFRLTPRLQYAEKEALQQLNKTTGARNIQRRASDGEAGGTDRDLSRQPSSKEIGQEYISHHELEQDTERARMEESCKEEIESNIAEARQRAGEKVHFGDCVQFQHIESGLFLTVLKEQSQERGNKKVCLEEGSEACIFVVEPAFKSYSSGDEVSSGGQVVLRSFAKVGGQYRFLNMSRGTAPKVAAARLASAAAELQVNSTFLRTVEEVNASAEIETSHIWRPLLTSSWNQQETQKAWLKAEDIICLYHREAESYLDYEPFRISHRPQLKYSRRVSSHDRKKSSWLWKIESTNIQASGGQVDCSGGKHYRIRHVVTGEYLVVEEDELIMQDHSCTAVSQRDASSSFRFKQFDKRVTGSHVEYWSLMYIRDAFKPQWVTENTWLSNWFKNPGSEISSGLEWEIVGDKKPIHGRELNNPELAKALTSKHTFSQKEFDALRIVDLHVNDFIKSGESYFKPAAISCFNSDERDYLKKVFYSNCKQARAELHASANATWDVFISYRQESDIKLVELLYKSLISLTVLENGNERKLRVFWDVKELEKGKDWQDSFLQAITNSCLIVSVLSSGTFSKMHNLTPSSACDNVVLEQEIALILHETGKAVIFPLLVGNLINVDGVGEVYTDFFSDGCMGTLPDIQVEQIGEKLQNILPNIISHKSPSRTVKQVFDEILRVQGAFLKGDRIPAVEYVVHAIHDCVGGNLKMKNPTEGDPGNLYLEPEELRVTLSRLGWTISQSETDKIVSSFDQNGDGKIDEGEFSELLVWLKRNMSRILRDAASDSSADSAKMRPPSEVSVVRKGNGVPIRDAFLIIPVSQNAYSRAVKVRDQINVLKHFQHLLMAVTSMSPDPVHDFLEEIGIRMDTSVTPDARILDIVVAQQDIIVNVVTNMLMELSHDDDDDPLSREGMSNRLVQKLVRECQGIEVTMSIIKMLTTKNAGIDVDLIATDRRLSGIKTVATYLYRFMKQTIRENITNCKRLYLHVDTILSHLGKGLSCMQVVKELFIEKSDLISKITKNQIEKIVHLLDEIKDPRYIDFMLNICTCNSVAMTRVQGYITQSLLIENKHHLPQFKIDGGTLLLSIKHKDGDILSETGDEWRGWTDISKFKRQVERGGKWRDYASEIMSKSFESLQPQEKKFRYFVRCTNLFGKLALGRNQNALRALLFNETLSLSYAEVLTIMRMECLPLLVRARFTTLMRHLYVDRDPNIQKPYVLYTRVWKKYSADDDALESNVTKEECVKASLKPIPACGNNFVDTREFVLQDLKTFGGTNGRDAQGNHAILAKHITSGQIEYMTAQVELCYDLLRFSLLTQNRNSISADLSNARRLFEVLFQIINVQTDPETVRLKSKEGSGLLKVRAMVLKVMAALLDLRVNFRLSLAVHAYESIFEKMQQARSQLQIGRSLNKRSDSMLSMSVNSTTSVESSQQDSMKAAMLRGIFAPYDELFKELSKNCFMSSIVCPDHIGADKVLDSYEGNVVIECLLGLCAYKDLIMSETIMGLIVRQASQHVRFNQDLSLVSLLAYPDSVDMFKATSDALRRFSGIQNRLFLDETLAYDEASSLIEELASKVTLSDAHSMESVKMNQKILLDLQFENVLTNILRLSLDRESPDNGAQNSGSDEPVQCDVAMNIPRRKLFQEVLDMLRCFRLYSCVACALTLSPFALLPSRPPSISLLPSSLPPVRHRNVACAVV